jgi:hypothetical protein
MSNIPIAGFGDGTRPTTSGGVDNMGGAEKFSAHKNEAGEDLAGPAPQERMREKRKSVEATKHDDSAAFGLNEDLTPEANHEEAKD